MIVSPSLTTNQMNIDQSARHSRNQKEIHTYETSHTLYSLAWSLNSEYPFRMAAASCCQHFQNKISIISLIPTTGMFISHSFIEQTYPPTKIMFIPDNNGLFPDLFATSGEYLRLYSLKRSSSSLECTLNSYKSTNKCVPITSFDWNVNDLSMVGVSSIDTTCTIWNIETGQSLGRTAPFVSGSMQMQLLAHDLAVLDIAFNPGPAGRDLFISSGIDGSIRLFDLRHLEHSTIIYENVDPICRVQWNKINHNLIAFFTLNSKDVSIIDVRMPCKIQNVLSNHSDFINAFCWAPHSSRHICTVADDRQALIWDLNTFTHSSSNNPILSYDAKSEINNVQWSELQPEWLSIATSNTIQILRV
ncbi:hypothetical protein GJ496_008863 [Pomphorhynchus laevis]|nr:hypothetical protein GJ496_008863 [Pomphorhynchus laevis]